jgi:hypothetical protein
MAISTSSPATRPAHPRDDRAHHQVAPSPPALSGRGAKRAVFLAALALIAASFAVGAMLHAGVQLQVAGLRLAEPVIVPAAIVESICAALFAAAVLVAARPGLGVAGARVVRGAHVVGIAGVLLGMTTLALGRGPRTEFNDLYHVAVLTLMLITGAWFQHASRPGGGGEPAADRRDPLELAGPAPTPSG